MPRRRNPFSKKAAVERMKPFDQLGEQERKAISNASFPWEVADVQEAMRRTRFGFVEAVRWLDRRAAAYLKSLEKK